MAASYSPGAHLAVVVPGTTLVVEGGAGDAAALHALLATGPTPEQVLDVLLRAAGGMGSLPGLALLTGHGEGRRVLVRGGLEVTTDGVAVRARPGEVWTQSRCGETGPVVVTGPGDDVGGPVLPLADGAALVGRLTLDPGASPSAATRPADVTLAPDEPAPRAPAPPQAAAVVTTVPTSFAPVGEYDDLVGASSLGAPWRDEPAPAPVTPTARAGDHDGSTVARSELADLLVAAPTPPPPSADGPLVLALHCPQGHPSPPHAADCRRCGQPATGPARWVPRPVLGALVLPTGARVPLERPLVVGRRPRAVRVHGDDVPQMVAVSSPDQVVSGSHLEVRLDGWHVRGVDLHSTNGTTLRKPGEPDRRLDPAEPAQLASGDRLDLGDGVVLGFEGLP